MSYNKEFFQHFLIGKRTKISETEDYFIYLYYFHSAKNPDLDKENEKEYEALEEKPLLFISLIGNVLEIWKPKIFNNEIYFEPYYIPIENIYQILASEPLKTLMEPIPPNPNANYYKKFVEEKEEK